MGIVGKRSEGELACIKCDNLMNFSLGGKGSLS